MRDSIQRVLKGSAASALGLVARTLDQLIMVPVLLSAWSVQLYGEWLIIAAIPIYLSLSDMGFVTAGSNELTRRAQDGITDEVRSFFGDYVSVYVQWSALILAVVAVASIFLPFDQMFSLSLMSDQVATATFLALIAAALAAQNSLTLLAGVRAKRLFHVGLSMKAVATFLRILTVSSAVLFMEAGPVVVAMITLAMQCFEIAGMTLFLVIKDFAPRLRFLRMPREPMLPILKTGLEYMLFPLAQAIVLQGMVLMVGAVLGAAAVAIFSTHRTLSRVTSQIVQLGVTPLRAEMGLLHGEENKLIVQQLLIRVSRMTFWASVVVASALLMLGRPLFESWTSGEISFNAALFATLVGGTIMEGIWRTSGAVRLGTNRHRPLAWGYLSISVSGLLLAYFLISAIGVSGAGIPALLMELAMFLLVVLLNRPLIGMDFFPYLRAIVQPPVKDLLALARHFDIRRHK